MCGAGAYICVPQKNGNRNWAGLVHSVTYGHPPGSVEEFYRTMAEFSKKHIADALAKAHVALPGSPADLHTIFLISRNPYTRVASYFLDKRPDLSSKYRSSSKARRHGFQSAQQHPDWHTLPAPTPAAFEDWLRFLRQLTRAANGDHSDAALCVVNHHLCSQARHCLWEQANYCMNYCTPVTIAIAIAPLVQPGSPLPLGAGELLYTCNHSYSYSYNQTYTLGAGELH